MDLASALNPPATEQRDSRNLEIQAPLLARGLPFALSMRLGKTDKANTRKCTHERIECRIVFGTEEWIVRKDQATQAGSAGSLPASHAVSSSVTTPNPYFASSEGDFVLYCGDAIELLPKIGIGSSTDLIFADPPYFLSNGGITCHAGKMVSVNKGAWDRLDSVKLMHEFNRQWLDTCRAILQPHGSIWVSGTRHVIFSVGFAMQELGFKLLNEITWEKPNPPPNLSCHYFTHSTETILWAARDGKSRHKFNYQLMRAEAGDRQMKSVWRLTAPTASEKESGSHPTQKPLALLDRIILASTDAGDLVVDPFSGSGTTGISAVKHGRRFIGIDIDTNFLDLAIKRYTQQNAQAKLL
jgi:site-specific DNA-methyltransferase (adenine-specific)